MGQPTRVAARVDDEDALLAGVAGWQAAQVAICAYCFRLLAKERGQDAQRCAARANARPAWIGNDKKVGALRQQTGSSRRH